MVKAALGENVFIHFLEHEVLQLVGQRRGFADEADTAFRMALLMGEAVVVPATAYWEDRWARPLLERYAPFRHAGRLQLMGTAASPEEYLTSKREHYRSAPRRYPAYFEDPPRAELDRLRELWRGRMRSTTIDIATGWREQLVRGDVLFEQLLRRPGVTIAHEAHLADVPELLGPDAFISDFVVRALKQRGVVLDEPQHGLVGRIINRLYNRSWLLEIGATVVRNGPTAALDELLNDAPFAIDLRRLRVLMSSLGLKNIVAALTAHELLEARESVEWQSARGDLLARASRPVGELWDPSELAVVARLALPPRSAVQALRDISRAYTAEIAQVARDRLEWEAEMEGKRKGTRYEISGEGHDFEGAHFGDRYGDTFHASVSVTGGRMQLGGTAIDLHAAAPERIRQAIVELIATAEVDDVPEALAAIDRAITVRDDLLAEEITAEIVEAFSEPRQLSVTERLRSTASRIGQEVAINAASTGVVAAVLEGLKLLGLA